MIPTGLEGPNYKFDNPRIQLFDEVAMSVGRSLFQAYEGNAGFEVAPTQMWEVFESIRIAIETDIAQGNWYRAGMMYVPPFAGITMCHVGMISDKSLKPERIEADEDFVRISKVKISDKVLTVAVSNVYGDRIVTATADGTVL
jgi:hypothetical protein